MPLCVDPAAFRAAVADSCPWDLGACQVAATTAGERYGAGCVELPLFEGGPPLSRYVCTGSTPLALRRVCPTPNPDPGTATGPAVAVHDRGVDVPVVPVGIGLGLAGTAVLGRTGRLPGLPGETVTNRIGSKEGKQRVVDRMNAVATRKLRKGGWYNPVGLEAAFTRSQFYDLQNAHLAKERQRRLAIRAAGPYE